MVEDTRDDFVPRKKAVGAILEVRRLSKAFGGLIAVRDVSMTIGEKEVVGVIGPNGAGKTSLLNLISGFLLPNSGSILFRGVSSERMPPNLISRLGMARTFQQIRLFRQMTVLENCLAGMHTRFDSTLLDVLGRTRRFRGEVKERIGQARELLSEFDLGGVEDRLAGTLPYGVQRRVEIVRALGSRPCLLCLDEPAAGMNEVESQEVSEIIAMLPTRGVSVLLIEHDMRVIRRVSHRAMALNEGSVIATGSPEEVLADPRVVEAYLGTTDA